MGNFALHFRKLFLICLLLLTIIAFTGCHPTVFKSTGTPEFPSQAYDIPLNTAYSLSLLAVNKLNWFILFDNFDDKKIVAFTPKTLVTDNIKVIVSCSKRTESITTVDIYTELPMVTDWGKFDDAIASFYLEFSTLAQKEISHD